MAAFLVALLAAAAPLCAQTIHMKDGRVIVAKSLRRDGDTIVATVDLPPVGGQTKTTGDLGYPLAQITRLDFPEPPPMRSAPDLIAQGKSAEALAQLEPVVKYYEGFRDAPGSWWAPLIVLKIEALNSAGKEAEAASLTEQTLQLAKDPEAQRALRARQAANLARQGKTAEAEEICDTVIKESKDARTLAAAYLAKGQCLLAKKQWEDAMLAFLETPVFYPGEKVELPKSMLGIGRAQFGMDNFTEARAALNDLIKTYAASTEAMQAKTELDNIARREKALAAPK